VAYPVQRAAFAVYSQQGQAEIRERIDYYLENARLVRQVMAEQGLDCVGGEDSPYIWIRSGLDSWEFFDLLLNQAGIVCTPGAGFGRCGQDYIRISAFNSRENIDRAMRRFQRLER
jgi:LL-diaminopimelate aminotransferase